MVESESLTIRCTECGMSLTDIEGATSVLEQSGYEQAAMLMRFHPRCCEPYVPSPPPKWYTRQELEAFVEAYTQTIPAQYPPQTRFHFGFWSVEVSAATLLVMPYHVLVPGGIWEYREHRVTL